MSDDEELVDAVACRLLEPDGRLPDALSDGPSRNLLLVYFGYGPISNGGFDSFFAGTLPDDPHYRRFHAALSAVGLTKAADVFGRVLALFGPDGPPTDDRIRLTEFRKADGKIKGGLTSEFFAAMRPMGERLAAYIRARPAEFPDQSIPPQRDWDADPYVPPTPTVPEPGSLADRLSRLSYRDRVAFAGRCARRVLPLFDRGWPDATPARRATITEAVEAAEEVGRGGLIEVPRRVVVDVISTAGRANLAMTGHTFSGDKPPDEPPPGDGNQAALAANVAKAAHFAVETASGGEGRSVENATQAWLFAAGAGRLAGVPMETVLDRDLTRLLHGKPLGRVRKTLINPKRWWQVWER